MKKYSKKEKWLLAVLYGLSAIMLIAFFTVVIRDYENQRNIQAPPQYSSLCIKDNNSIIYRYDGDCTYSLFNNGHNKIKVYDDENRLIFEAVLTDYFSVEGKPYNIDKKG